jgi:sialic acid synthase SpsE
LVFITAEIGVNWNGDFHLIEKMMKDAKNAGCDAVKLQAFDEKIVGDNPNKDRLLETSVSAENINEIQLISKKVGIEWYCTPMYADAISFLDEYVKRYKIRFADSLDLHKNQPSPLISRVLKTNKEIIISSQKNPKNLELYNNKNIKWLYVVPKYPCTLDEIDFSCLKDFQGYSNHCRDSIAPLTAAILGAEMIEIHVTSDKEKNYFDNPVSFDPSETEHLVQLIRKTEKINR